MSDFFQPPLEGAFQSPALRLSYDRTTTEAFLEFRDMSRIRHNLSTSTRHCVLSHVVCHHGHAIQAMRYGTLEDEHRSTSRDIIPLSQVHPDRPYPGPRPQPTLRTPWPQPPHRLMTCRHLPSTPSHQNFRQDARNMSRECKKREG